MEIRGARILLAEDNQINQQVAKEILINAGLRVSISNNGQEAVDAVISQAFDAVLMNIQMPVMDGYEASRRIRLWEKELNGQDSKLKENGSDELSAVSFQPSARARRVPIIAMTAHAMAGDREKCLEVGMDDHVAKPINTSQLFATLAKWIHLKSGRRIIQWVDIGYPAIPSMPTELAKKTAENIFAALETGNVQRLKNIAETLITSTGEFAGLGKKIRLLTDDFDFDGILILARELELQAEVKD